MICSSSPERTGRDGALALRFEQRDGKTVLSQSRFRLPLQVLAPVYLDNHAAYVMLLNPTGGVLGGDRLLTEVVQGPDTHACLTTPSATRVYRSSGEPAVQDTVVRLARGATWEYLPEHVIPHAGARFRQSLRVEMEPGSRAIIFDSMASGRVAHGERWAFAELESRVGVWLRGRPAYVNHTKFVPGLCPPEQLGLAEEFDYLASLTIIAENVENWSKVAGRLREALEAAPEVAGGVSLLTANGCAARILARSTPALTLATMEVWAVVRELVLGLPPLEQRKY